MKRAAFIGRWQPFHKGHEWLVRQKLDQGIPCLLLIRDVCPDQNNQFSSEQVLQILKAAFHSEDVSFIIIPDIESVNYGRGVGYEVNEMIPPGDIGIISGTEIRERIHSGDPSWRDFISPKAQPTVEQICRELKP
jgi:nicotinamide mononucleotide adenylyltransferase